MRAAFWFTGAIPWAFEAIHVWWWPIDLMLRAVAWIAILNVIVTMLGAGAKAMERRTE